MQFNLFLRLVVILILCFHLAASDDDSSATTTEEKGADDTTPQSLASTSSAPDEDEEFACYSCDNGVQGNTSCERGKTEHMNVIKMDQCMPPKDFISKNLKVGTDWIKRNPSNRGSRGRMQEVTDTETETDLHVCVMVAEWSNKISRPQVHRGCVRGTEKDIKEKFKQIFAVNVTIEEDNSTCDNKTTIGEKKIRLCLCKKSKCNNLDSGADFFHLQTNILLLMSFLLTSAFILNRIIYIN